MRNPETVLRIFAVAVILQLPLIAFGQNASPADNDFMEYARFLREEAKLHREFIEGLLRQVVYLGTPLVALFLGVITWLQWKTRKDVKAAVDKRFDESVDARITNRLLIVERRFREEMDNILERMGEKLEESERIVADFVQLRRDAKGGTSDKSVTATEQTLAGGGGDSPLEEGGYYIVHKAWKVKGEDDYYNIRFSIDIDIADEKEAEEAMSRIEKVVYHLHESFDRPVVEMTNSDENFEMKITVWGQFPIWAELHMKDGQKKVVIRYLNFW